MLLRARSIAQSKFGAEVRRFAGQFSGRISAGRWLIVPPPMVPKIVGSHLAGIKSTFAFRRPPAFDFSWASWDRIVCW
jgi:hypothetical protein